MSPDRQRHFHQELDALKSRLFEMSGTAEALVSQAVEAFLEQDPVAAQAVLDGDARVNRLEKEIDHHAIELLALQQPMASDLRLITTAMKISNDLERVGDHAANIARQVQLMAESIPFVRTPELVEMARLALTMLADSLDAFMRGDTRLAREVCQRDDEVDHLHNAMFRILLTHMMEDPRRIGPSMSLLMISKNLERIADLATNIGEDVVFLVDGIDIRHGGGPTVDAGPSEGSEGPAS